MGTSRKSSKLTSFIAALCIVAYIAAIAFASARIILNIRERQTFAEKEFYDLADRATSSSVFLGFMTEAYQATIRDFLTSSETLLGIIITGPSGEYSFERYPGSGIVWAGDSPRFKTGAGFPREPFFLPLGIEGQRNVTIQAVYGLFDYSLFQEVLKSTLLLVLSTLIVAFLTLLVELTLNKRAGYYKSTTIIKTEKDDRPAKQDIPLKPAPEPKVQEDFKVQDEFKISEELVIPAELNVPTETPRAPSGSDSSEKTEAQVEKHRKPRGNIGRESHTKDRVSSELHRCASFEQDMVLLVMELISVENIDDTIDGSLYSEFTEEAVNFFTSRDLVFGKGENGVSIILPGADLGQGIAKSEEFRRLTLEKKPEFDLCIGLSSRSERLLDANRLMLEANSALKKAKMDPISRIVAFKSDPDKYREFIKENF